MDLKMTFRKTTNYNANIVVKDLNGNSVDVVTAYATFTTGESITKTMIINNEELYLENKDEVNNLIEEFSGEVDKLAEFHNVPLV